MADLSRFAARSAAILAATVAAGALVVAINGDQGPDPSVDDVAGGNARSTTTADSTIVGDPSEPTEGGSNGDGADANLTVAISEINYHPDDDDGLEFVEIHNFGERDVDLGGWTLSGADHEFATPSVIAAGSRIIVRGDEFGDGLDDGGERLALTTSDGTEVDAVEYDDRDHWPAMADGHGDTLQRIDPAAAGTNPGNWLSAAPSPGGGLGRDSSVMPVWTDVQHTIRPTAGQPVTVTAQLDDQTASIELNHRVGFEAEQRLAVDVDADGLISATIPGQPAGSLVRYRLVATTADGTTGTWPRQGDGAMYTGTTVATDVPGPLESAESDLVRIEWFMDESDYRDAFDNRSLTSRATSPGVVAVDGQIFDNAQFRVKGRSSLGFPKPKWKVDLPPGHRLQVDGWIDHAIDEFALHAAYNDKSFMREVLSHELMADAGLPVANAFPVQVDRNGAFDGLYVYIEQSDGRWRRRVDLEDASVYEVGADGSAFLSPGEAELPDDELALRYDRENGVDDVDLRMLLIELDAISGADVDAATRRQWFFEQVDVPSIINSLAASAIIQHRDFLTKNYRLARSNGRWSMIPYDLELTWGRTFAADCQSLCDDVGIEGPFILSNTSLIQPFTDDPVLSDMLRTRIATLRDTLLLPERVERRVEDLLARIDDAAQRDREVWGTYGRPQRPEDAARELLDGFVLPQHDRLRRSDAPFELATVAAAPSVEDLVAMLDVVGDTSGEWAITNVGNRTVDISGLDLSGFVASSDGPIVRPGIVLTPGLTVRIAVDGTTDWIRSG